MPAWGLIPDSPIFYYGTKAIRSGRGATGGGRARGASFGYKVAQVVIYEAELKKFLNTDYKKDAVTLWKYLEKRNMKALIGARRQVGVKTGALQRNIRSYHLGNATGQYAGLIADKPYALMHHEGTKPHIIRPANPGGTLVFRKGSRVISTREVRHPGTKPNRYLSNQLIHYRG